MCNCGLNECSFCNNQLNRWVMWCEYVQWVLERHKPHTRDEIDLRLGQKLFNALCEYRCDVADQIRGSIVDPFNDDDMIPAFLEKVDELWML
jgi:hypothetical protein